MFQLSSHAFANCFPCQQLIVLIIENCKCNVCYTKRFREKFMKAQAWFAYIWKSNDKNREIQGLDNAGRA